MSPTNEVPDSYLGAWQQMPPGNVQAFWLQTRRLHAYLRIPAGRPDLSARNSLAECDLDELMWLAGQEGAAGACIVEGDTLHRRRQLDFSTTRGMPFLRRMQCNGELLQEDSLRGRDQVSWRNISGKDTAITAFRFQDETLEGSPQVCKGMLLVAGEHFIFVRDRDGYAMQAQSLQVLAECKDYGPQELIPLLDFEISYGLKQGGELPWEIRLSTLPFREGKALLAPGEFEAILQNWQRLPQKIRRDGTTLLRRWSLDEAPMK